MTDNGVTLTCGVLDGGEWGRNHSRPPEGHRGA